MSLAKVLLGLTALLVALSFVSAYDFNSLPQLFSEGFVVESESDHHMTLFNMKDKRTIVLNKNPNPLDVLTEKITKHKNAGVKTASFKAALGGAPENAVPVFKGAVKPDGSITTWGAPCFQKYSAQLKLDDTTAYITLNADEPKSLFCNDWLLFLSRGSFSVKNVFFRGKSTIEIKMKPDEIQDITANGIFVFNFPDGLFGTLVDLWNVYQIFDGKHMEADNVKFLSRTMNMAFNPRTNNTLVIPDESTIDDGDYIAVTRLDGLDPLIMYGTGGHIGHTAVFLRFDGELYVCESTDKNPFGQSYWPPPYGIIRTPYRQWLQQAANAGYIVGFAKLAPELRAKFNADAARAWFLNGIEGLPYGYHNFIFGWIDTVDQNYPYPLSAQLVVAALPILEKFIPANISGIFLAGINKRLEYYYNVTSPPCEDVFCMYSRLDDLNISFSEVVTLVEHDEWKYYDGYSMVCDVFVLEMYKTAGIFDPALAAQIQATEFSPKDVYQMQIFDTTWVAPAACQVPGFSTNFCQLLGDYWWPLPEFNSVPVYPHMNEHCGAMPPQYVRGPAGC